MRCSRQRPRPVSARCGAVAHRHTVPPDRCQCSTLGGSLRGLTGSGRCWASRGTAGARARLLRQQLLTARNLLRQPRRACCTARRQRSSRW
jgi:hypothetical protein